MMKVKYLRLSIIFSIPILLLVACKATEAPDSGFIKRPNVLYHNPKLPFHKVWFSKNKNLKNYDKIIVAPVTLSYTQKQDYIARQNLRYYLSYKKEDFNYIAKYFRQAFIKAFRNAKNNRFKITEKRGYKTLILQIAIVEIVPTKVLLNGFTTAFTFVPLGPILYSLAFTLIALPLETIVSGITESGFKSYIAFEAVFRDSISGRVIIAFKDREAKQASLFNIKDYTYYGHILSIIDKWTKQTVKMLNRKNNEKIKDSSAFVLDPF